MRLTARLEIFDPRLLWRLWRLHLNKRNARLTQKAATVFVRIWAGVNNPLDSSIDDHLGASDAWLMRDIDLAAGCTNAVQSCLNDGVLLSVQRT